MRVFLQQVIRRVALLRHARALCHKPDVLHGHPRSSLQLLEVLEEYVTRRRGKEVFADLKDLVLMEKRVMETEKRDIEFENEYLQRVIQLEKENIQMEKKWLRVKHELMQSEIEDLRVLGAIDRVVLLEAQGRNDTRGLFEKLQEVLAARAGVTTTTTTTTQTGAHLWEAILTMNQRLRLCIEECTNIPANDVGKQAAHCNAIYSVLSQHEQVGQKLRAARGKIVFQRGPMSTEQVHTFLCIGQEVGFAIVEYSSTRPY